MITTRCESPDKRCRSKVLELAFSKSRLCDLSVRSVATRITVALHLAHPGFLSPYMSSDQLPSPKLSDCSEEQNHGNQPEKQPRLSTIDQSSPALVHASSSRSSQTQQAPSQITDSSSSTNPTPPTSVSSSSTSKSEPTSEFQIPIRRPQQLPSLSSLVKLNSDPGSDRPRVSAILRTSDTPGARVDSFPARPHARPQLSPTRLSSMEGAKLLHELSHTKPTHLLGRKREAEPGPSTFHRGSISSDPVHSTRQYKQPKLQRSDSAPVPTWPSRGNGAAQFALPFSPSASPRGPGGFTKERRHSQADHRPTSEASPLSLTCLSPLPSSDVGLWNQSALDYLGGSKTLRSPAMNPFEYNLHPNNRELPENTPSTTPEPLPRPPPLTLPIATHTPHDIQQGPDSSPRGPDPITPVSQHTPSSHASSSNLDTRPLTTADGAKLHYCPYPGCSRAPFTRPSSLKLHYRTHTGERPFPCPHCTSAFASKGNLTAHVRVHTGERPYACEACGSRFNQIPHLKRHLQTHGLKGGKAGRLNE